MTRTCGGGIYLLLVRPQVGLQLVLVGGGVFAARAGAGQEQPAVLLHNVAFQAALGDGRVVALAAVVHVLLGVRAHVEVIVHLVPEELSCGAPTDRQTDRPTHRGWWKCISATAQSLIQSVVEKTSSPLWDIALQFTKPTERTSHRLSQGAQPTENHNSGKVF